MAIELLWLILWPSLVAGAYALQVRDMTKPYKPAPTRASATDTHTLHAQSVMAPSPQPQAQIARAIEYSRTPHGIYIQNTYSTGTAKQIRMLQAQANERYARALADYQAQYTARWDGWHGLTQDSLNQLPPAVRKRLLEYQTAQHKAGNRP